MPDAPALPSELDVAVVGGGQSALAIGWYLRRTGLRFALLDAEDGPGGAWRHAWPSLRLFSPAQWSSLPGWPMPADPDGDEYPGRAHVLWYLREYERRYDLPVHRPVRVHAVRHDDEGDDGDDALRLDTNAGPVRARAVVSATGTWASPVIPDLPGRERFAGRVLHSAEYDGPDAFAGRDVIVVGGGNSGAQIVAELADVARVTWATREPPRFLPDDVDGRVLFAQATERWKAMQAGRTPPPPRSLGDVVMVAPVRRARALGRLEAVPMFARLTERGAEWSDGTVRAADAVILATGFRSARSTTCARSASWARTDAWRCARTAAARGPRPSRASGSWDTASGRGSRARPSSASGARRAPRRRRSRRRSAPPARALARRGRRRQNSASARPATPAPAAMRLAPRAALLVALSLPACTRPDAASGTPDAPDGARVAVRAPSGMVVSASAIASAVGRDVLAAGGNAVDAAVATGLALAVTYPSAGNVGGGGFMVIRFPDGRATTIDFREVAPAAATPTMFVDSAGLPSPTLAHASHLAVGVPGTVAGFALAHERHGSGDWQRLVEPAVRLAEDGFAVPPGLAGELARMRDRLARWPASIAAYYRGGEPYAAGDTLRQPDLARTLARIRDEGRDGFYRGETARLIAAETRRHGGLITEADLAAYEPREREPVRGTYRGHEIVSMPPPSSGGVALVTMLNVLEGYDVAASGPSSPRTAHLLAEAMRRAFRDRARHLGDPDFATIPVARLTGAAHADSLRATIDTLRATPSVLEDVAAWRESDETTHYSVVDASGMAVSVTYTLEAGYGLGAVVEGAGFLLNNEMGDFNQAPGHTDSTGHIGTAANEVRPRKRMLSSMTPTIVARDGRLVAVVGSPGGRTIINTVLQVVSNVVDHGMDIQAAVSAPRLHHQWMPDRVRVERGYPTATVEALRRMGHRVEVGGEQGTAHSIMIDPRTGERVGAADPRDPDAGAVGH